MLFRSIDIAAWRMSLDVHDDPTDTWSHSAGDRFDGRKLGTFKWQSKFEVREQGPLRAALLGEGRYGNSQAWLKVMLYEDEPMAILRLSIMWSEVRQLLRLRFTAPERISNRTDLVSGGALDRNIDGLEYPLACGMLLQAGQETLGIGAPVVC